MRQNIFDSMKTILLTGGSGLLALNWAYAIRHSHHVILVQHQRTVSMVDVRTQTMDLESSAQITEALNTLKPDLVIHTAGLTSVELCEKNPVAAQRVNVDVAEKVAQACKIHGLPLVHISTDHLFAGDRQNMHEEDLISPVNVYARTKAEAESRVLDTYPAALVIRTNFYGWGPSYRRSFSDVIIDALRKKAPLTLFTDVYYTPVLIQAAVEAIHAILEKQAAGIFNVVGSERISKFEFGMQIAEMFELDPSYISPGHMGDQPSIVRRPLDMSLSDQKIVNVLGRNLGSVKQHLTQLRQQERDGQAKEIQTL